MASQKYIAQLSRMKNAASWLKATRPYSYPASISPVLLGLAYSYYHQKYLLPFIAIMTLFSALLMQVAANLFNDYYDWKNEIDTDERVGFKRLSSLHGINHKHILYLGILCALVAGLIGIYLIAHGGLLIALIGIASLLFAYLYTGGPYPLAYHRLGELVVILFFGPIAVGGSYYLQTHNITYEIVRFGLAPGLIGASIMAINNLRDRDQDAKAGKKTIANSLTLHSAKSLPIILVLLAMISSWHLANIVLFLFYVPIAKNILLTDCADTLNKSLVRTGHFLILYTFTHCFLALI